MGTFREVLKEQHGWIIDHQIDDAIKEFGKDFEVVLKTYEHGRPFVSLQTLKELPKTNPVLCKDIREVFVSATQYKKMFGKFY